MVCHQWDGELQSRSSSFAFTGAYDRRRLTANGPSLECWGDGGKTWGKRRVNGKQQKGGALKIGTTMYLVSLGYKGQFLVSMLDH